MKKIATLTLLLLIGLNASVAQKRVTIKKIESRLITNEGIEFVGTLRDKNSDHYMFPRWSNNGVLYVGREVYGIGNINFNITTNAIDSRIAKDKLFMFNSSDVDSISINNHLFKKVGNLFYEVLFEKENSMFLKKYDIKYEAGHEGRMGGVTGPSQTSVIFRYVVVDPERKMNRVELNKKSILEVFQNKKEVLESYAKKKNLSFRKEEDIVKMLEYISDYSS